MAVWLLTYIVSYFVVPKTKPRRLISQDLFLYSSLLLAFHHLLLCSFELVQPTFYPKRNLVFVNYLILKHFFHNDDDYHYSRHVEVASQTLLELVKEHMGIGNELWLLDLKRNVDNEDITLLKSEVY